jgi:hypothetical protein
MITTDVGGSHLSAMSRCGNARDAGSKDPDSSEAASIAAVAMIGHAGLGLNRRGSQTDLEHEQAERNADHASCRHWATTREDAQLTDGANPQD